MKSSLVTAVCVAALLMASTNAVRATNYDEPLTITVDAIVVRPACLVATVVGSVVFVVALPVAATSKSVKKAAKTLVVAPAKATFTRKLGDMDSL